MHASETQQTIVPAFSATPALTNSTLGTPSSPTVAGRNDPVLATPGRNDDIADISASFIVPSTSYDITQFSNLNDVMPEWEDDEVEEIMLLAPKAKSRSAALLVTPASSDPELGCPLEMRISSFSCLQTLSTSPSSISRVSLAKHAQSGSLYAVKTFSKAQLFYDAPKLEEVMTEQMMLKLLTQLELPFVLKLRWSFQDKEALYLVTDHCSGGDLCALLTSSSPLHPTHARFYAAELVEALWSLHNSGVTHCAIKPDHILFGADGHLALTGFAHATVSGPNSPRTLSPSVSCQSHQGACADGINDVSEWSAPEVVLGWSHDPVIDCWGFGMILYFMLTGQHPFMNDLEAGVHKSIVNSMILHAPLDTTGYEGLISKEARDILSQTLVRNPRLRMTMDDIKAHVYFINTDWDRLRCKGYDAPLAIAPYKPTDEHFDSAGLGSSESLSGVRITGFDFSLFDREDASPENICTQGGPTIQEPLDVEDKELYTAPENDVQQGVPSPQITQNSNISSSTAVDDVQTQAERESQITPGSESGTAKSSLCSNAPSTAAQSGTSAPSTALYSCTSFGELREAMKSKERAREGELAGLAEAVSGVGSDSALVSGLGLGSRSGSGIDDGSGSGSGSDTVSGSGTIAGSGADPGPTASGSSTGLCPTSPSDTRMQQPPSTSPIRPVSIMRKPSTISTNTSLTTRTHSLGRGLGLRKYASLNFELDTIVSLDADLSGLSGDGDGDADVSGVSSFLNLSDVSSGTAVRARRRVSFLDVQTNAKGDGKTTMTPGRAGANPGPTTLSTPRSARADSNHGHGHGFVSPSWRSLTFGRYASPASGPSPLQSSGTPAPGSALTSTPGSSSNTNSSANANANKLRKKRATSTPTHTPQLRVALPAGLEQIGLGIGYTYTRPPGQGASPPVAPPAIASYVVQDAGGEKGVEGPGRAADANGNMNTIMNANTAMGMGTALVGHGTNPSETPRRSVSLGASVARCGALFANLAKGAAGRRTSYGVRGARTGDVGAGGDGGRASEESDAMEAVMREMYGGAWDAELGVVAYGHGGGRRGGGVGGSGSGGSGEDMAATRRTRAPGRVYAVHADHTLNMTGSTLRLVEPVRGEGL